MSTLDTLRGIGTVILIFGGVPMIIAVIALVTVHSSEKERNEIQRTYGEELGTSLYRDERRRMGNIAAAVSGVAVGVLLWLAWFSWGDPSGYATWAIVAAVISSLAAVIGLGFFTMWKRTGPFFVALGGLFGFSSAYAVDAGFYDTTGLWGVGYLILLVCAGLPLAIIAGAVSYVRTR